MIDVVFLLMCYFLTVAEFRAPEGALPVDLARAAALAGATPSADPYALPSPAIRVIVRSLAPGPEQSALTTDSPLLPAPPGGAFTPSGLRIALNSALGRTLEPDHRFVVAPAPGVRWEHAVGALDAVRLAGFQRVRLAPPGEAP